MRKLLGGLLAALALGSFGGLAHADKMVTGSWNEGNQTVHRVLLQRWGYTLGGPKFDMADAERVCAGAPVREIKGYRDAKDVSYSLFSLGWYTPQHVRVVCKNGPTTNY